MMFLKLLMQKMLLCLDFTRGRLKLDGKSAEDFVPNSPGLCGFS